VRSRKVFDPREGSSFRSLAFEHVLLFYTLSWLVFISNRQDLVYIVLCVIFFFICCG